MSTGEWTSVIKPKASIFSVNLRELYNYRYLLFILIRRDVVATYKQTLLGPLWFFIQPTLTTLSYVVIFTEIANIGTAGTNPLLFYLSGVTLWNYFADCLTKTAGTFVANASIFGKVYFPRLIIPLSTIVSSLYKLFIQLGLFLVVYAVLVATGKQELALSPWVVVILPFNIVVMAMLGFAMGTIISSLTVRYRDFTYMIGFGTQLLMYFAPVIYPLSVAQSKMPNLAYLLELNPMTPVIESFRFAFMQGGTISPGFMVYSFVFSFILFLISIVTFNKVERNFIDIV